jgi:hypothetical protein
LGLCSDELTTSGSLRFLLAAEGDAFLGGAAGVCVDLGEVEL